MCLQLLLLKRLKQNRLNRYFSQSEEASSTEIFTPNSDQESAYVGRGSRKAKEVSLSIATLSL